MSTSILSIFMNGLPKIRGIFGSALMSRIMKSTENENLSIYISTYVIILNGVLQVLFVICNVDANSYIYEYPNLSTINNGIIITLAPKLISKFPTFILPIETGNTIHQG